MPRSPTRVDALEEISGWDTEQVLFLLEKNGLQECCKAVTKRQVDGDEFLHLTEGKLLLWKSDLSRPQIWSLWTFVEEVKKCPEKYLEDKTDQQINEELKSAIASPGMGLEDKSNENVTQFRSNSMIPSKVLQREDQAFKQHIVNEKNLTCPNSEENCSFQSSMDSVYHPPSTTSQEEEEYEIYESITEVGDDDEYYLRPISRVKPVDVPPPLPDKLPSTPSPVPSIKASEKKADRSREKKFATLPNSGDESSGRSERASRPLPPPPDRLTYLDKPWFHNVTRNQAAALIKGQTSRGVPRDGYFLLRPSYSNPSNPLTLVVWCKDRVYNIPVRKRADNWYALGSEKSKEPVFASVEEIVSVYSREELLLDSEGVRTESTKLTETPSK
ncbi:B-cell linker protein isoform X4 [Orussus abietinus]|uniref:B-cell linker protein isoform X4 n=1 Tax=Orussus abietinus TaxID=222816 RepID=UPI0006269B45|nr:B-cell linker protein isoform X4 [Orussus abietinus]